MDKIEELMKMMEHPELYPDEKWKDMLRDEECRIYYNLMSKTDSAVNDPTVSDKDIDEEWHKLEVQHYAPTKNRILLWYKIAAVFVGLTLISSFAIAAIKGGWFRHTPAPQTAHTPSAIRTIDTIKAESRTKARDTLAVKTSKPVIRQYEDDTLENILDEMSDYYQVKIEYENTDARRLRLFFKWDQSYRIDEIVDQLNNFQQFHISLENKTLVVE